MAAPAPARAAAKATPVPTPSTLTYWEGTRAGELRLQRCGGCGRARFYPRPACPHCGSAEFAWFKASGRGRLHSYIINHLPPPGFEADAPYVVAAVELEEGPRMMANLVDVAPVPEALALDMALEVGFVPRGEQMLPVFRPARGGAA